MNACHAAHTVDAAPSVDAGTGTGTDTDPDPSR
jgi:hypothetical protein